jgi:hypothetical protein
MYDTQPAALAIEEHAIPSVIPLHDPFPCPVALERRHERVTLDSGASDLVRSHQFDDAWFGGDAPALATSPGVLALVPGVDIQAERGHGGIISGRPGQRKT